MIPKMILDAMGLTDRPVRHLWNDVCGQSVPADFRTTGRYEFPCEGAPVQRWLVMTEDRNFRLDIRCDLHADCRDGDGIRGEPGVIAVVPVSEDELTVIRVMTS